MKLQTNCLNIGLRNKFIAFSYFLLFYNKLSSVWERVSIYSINLSLLYKTLLSAFLSYLFFISFEA